MSDISYKNKYRHALSMALFLGVTAVILAAILTFQVMLPETPTYYASTTSGVVVPIRPLSEPVVTNKFIMQWAMMATRKALNLDFNNYQQQMDNMKGNFTVDGWQKFEQALNSSGVLSTVTSKKVQMSAVVSGAPVQLNRGIYNGRFSWTIQMPVLVTFSSASENQKMHLIVTMRVERIPTLNSAQGIAISDFVAENANY